MPFLLKKTHTERTASNRCGAALQQRAQQRRATCAMHLQWLPRLHWLEEQRCRWVCKVLHEWHTFGLCSFSNSFFFHFIQHTKCLSETYDKHTFLRRQTEWSCRECVCVWTSNSNWLSDIEWKRLIVVCVCVCVCVCSTEWVCVCVWNLALCVIDNSETKMER